MKLASSESELKASKCKVLSTHNKKREMTFKKIIVLFNSEIE